MAVCQGMQPRRRRPVRICIPILFSVSIIPLATLPTPARPCPLPLAVIAEPGRALLALLRANVRAPTLTWLLPHGAHNPPRHIRGFRCPLFSGTPPAMETVQGSIPRC